MSEIAANYLHQEGTNIREIMQDIVRLVFSNSVFLVYMFILLIIYIQPVLERTVRCRWFRSLKAWFANERSALEFTCQYLQTTHTHIYISHIFYSDGGPYANQTYGDNLMSLNASPNVWCRR